MKHIAIAGFQHETNTFSPVKTTFAHFQQADNWPELLIGPKMLEVMDAQNIPIAGFIQQAKKLDVQLHPLVWCSAPPSGIVTDDAFEKIVTALCDQLKKLNQCDAIYLDFHGAMVAEKYSDGEAEVLRRVRAVVGKDVFIAVSLDFHANTSPEMFALADVMLAYRTYPHVDMAEMGARAAETLAQQNKKPYKAYQQISFLVPIVSQCTLEDPAKAIYELLNDLEKQYHVSLSASLGFPLADVPCAGVAVFAYGEDQRSVDLAVKTLSEAIISHEKDFQLILYSPEVALKLAMQKAKSTNKPIILADTQDNSGCGGTSDTTGVLSAMLALGVKNAALGVLCDAEAARAAHQAGVDAEITIDLGARHSLPGQEPVKATFKVTALSNGRFIGTGPYYKNADMDLGLMAVLSINDIDIVVSSKTVQAADQTMFRHIGIDPTQKSILVLKSSVHFRADFAGIAEDILIVEAPGLNIANIKTLSYKHLRKGVKCI